MSHVSADYGHVNHANAVTFQLRFSRSKFKDEMFCSASTGYQLTRVYTSIQLQCVMVSVKHANKRACPSQIVPSIGVDMEANICHRHHHLDDIPSLTCHPQHHHLKETFLLIEALERNIAFITSTKQCM